MLLSTLAAAFLLALAPPQKALDDANEEPVIELCTTASIQDLLLPGSDAGILVLLNVSEGSFVKKDQVLAKIDDREAQATLTIKKLEYEVSQQKATSDIKVRVAQAKAEVTKAAEEKFKESNRKSKGSVTDIQILEAEFQSKAAKLGVDEAKEESASNKLEAQAKEAEYKAAKVLAERRELHAPFSGVVVKLHKKPGEWVAPGEPVLQLVRIDRLRVVGDIDARKWTPAELENRKVTVEIEIPRQGPLQVPGRIVFVSPIVLVNKVSIEAEIDTPIKDGIPLVRAGLDAKMVIHTKQPPEAAKQSTKQTISTVGRAGK